MITVTDLIINITSIMIIIYCPTIFNHLTILIIPSHHFQQLLNIVILMHPTNMIFFIFQIQQQLNNPNQKIIIYNLFLAFLLTS